MPHISDIHTITKPRFLIYGCGGSGKTTLLRTIPGKKFIYMFDPAGLNSLRSTDDFWVEEFTPGIVPMSVVTLKGTRDTGVKYTPAETYLDFEKDFEKRLSDGFFEKEGFTTIIFDSLTTLSDLIMDRILEINNRAGKNPELSDYGVQALVISRIVRSATSTNCVVVFTGHEKASQDKLLRTVANQILVPGQLVSKLPLLFSDIYHTTVQREGNIVKYLMETVPDQMFPTARCSFQKATPVIDVTLPKDCPDPTIYGLGKLLRDNGKYELVAGGPRKGEAIHPTER